MKHMFLYLVIIFHTIVSVADQEQIKNPEPLVVGLIMVKNEATVMRETIEPLIKAGIKSYLILDTGSTDDTIAQTLKTFEDYGIEDGYIIEQPFVDFATSRNYLIDRAEELFPQAGFFFMIDAEWYVQNPEIILPLCEQFFKLPHKVFVVSVSVGGDEEITANRLFKAHEGARFVGAVHEYIALNSLNILTPIRIHYRPRTAGMQKSEIRMVRDLEILFAEHKKDPTIVRHVFFIAQTYHCMHKIEDAAAWYKKASEMEGWDEMLFIAKYRLAQCYAALDNWPLALVTYLKAYSMRPTRIEPLMSIAIHYWNIQDRLVAFMFAKQAFAIEYPVLDSCYVNKAMYHEGRYDILARSAWYTGQYDIGMQAIKTALIHNPNSEHFKYLLDLFVEKLKG